MGLGRVVFTAWVSVGCLMAFATPASADCSGPSIERLDPVRRGEAVTVTGHAFGTSCNDTRRYPDGEGALGHPIADIEISIVQWEREVVVARGNAEGDYRFVVDVVVPPELEPGPAVVIARWASGAARRSIDVLLDAPVDGIVEVASFGPASRARATPIEQVPVARSDPGLKGLTLGLAATAALVIAAAVVGVVWGRRRNGARD